MIIRIRRPVFNARLRARKTKAQYCSFPFIIIEKTLSVNLFGYVFLLTGFVFLRAKTGGRTSYFIERDAPDML